MLSPPPPWSGPGSDTAQPTEGPGTERPRASTGSPAPELCPSPGKDGLRARMGLAGVARRTLGISLLLVTVFLWTASNFLASFIFSDHTYDKPFFLVYVNSSVFATSLVPIFARYLLRSGFRGLRGDAARLRCRRGRPAAGPDADDDDDAATAATAGERLLVDDEATAAAAGGKLGFRQTAGLSLEFSLLWFAANYFSSACLEHTSVASVTILTSTSSMWTLVFCAAHGVESFSLRKLVGVTASLVGIGLISTVDLTGDGDEHRGSFPQKTPAQMAAGDTMALFSAVVYGLYVTVMKRRVGDEDKVDMGLFFGLVGFFSLALLWPLFFVLHWTGIEPFEMPPTGKVWAVIVANSLSSFASDLSWALAMLLTTPLVATVGLSLTIPLSLIGEMVQYGQYSSFVYWVGAAVVFVSFLFINKESRDEARAAGPGADGGRLMGTPLAASPAMPRPAESA